jgi:hypothetical protein
MDNDSDKFVLYDAGENFTNKRSPLENLRKEYGCFIYRYEPCNVGNIRKMTIIFPSITIASAKDHKRASIDNTGPSDIYNDKNRNKKNENDIFEADNISKNSSVSNKKTTYKFVDW